MSNKYMETKSTVSALNDERRLHDLLRQHEQIGEEIIALVLKTTAEADHLIEVLQRQTKGLGTLYSRIQ